MKKVLGLAWILVLLLIAMPAVAEGEAWEWDRSNAILRLDGEASGDVVVPEVVDDYYVTALGINLFNGQAGVTSLTLPDTVYALRGSALSFMDNVTSIKLSENLQVILNGNISNCPQLTSITIPASVRYIDDAISSCENLREVRFEGVCPIIGDYVLDWLPADCKIYVPDDQLEAYTAALDEQVRDNIVPSGKNAVVTERVNPEEDFEFDAQSGSILGYEGISAFVTVPETIGGVPVKHIADGAFDTDYYVYAIILPEGVETIGNEAFNRASALCYVDLPASLRSIGDNAFYNAQPDTVILREGLETIGAGAFRYCHADELTLPSTVRSIGAGAFENARMYEVHISENIEHIGSRAFADSYVEYAIIDVYEMRDIAPDAFVDSYLADIDLPWDSSMENLRAYEELFSEYNPDCTVWINNPEAAGVAEMPENTLETLTIENGVWTYYNGEKQDLTVWSEYDDIPVTALGDGVFKGNQTIRTFWPHHCMTFTTIGNEAFADSSVEFVEMFPTITTIGDGAFRNCQNLTALQTPVSLETIGTEAYADNANLSVVILNEGLISLGDEAFRSCTALTDAVIPSSVEYVGEGLFAGCENLEKVTVLCDASLLPANVFEGCAALEEVYLAADATNEDLASVNAMLGLPWYESVARVGGEMGKLIEMPYPETDEACFSSDPDFQRLDFYEGTELSIAVPRTVDGVEMKMFGGNVMSNASFGDNYDMEIPVHTLIIPETYERVTGYALQNCAALETVICYAPLENIEDGMFNNCENLRNVVFVNGAKNISRYAFMSCPSLETVYFAGATEVPDFINFDMSPSFAAADVITDRALMPDIDQLLAESGIGLAAADCDIDIPTDTEDEAWEDEDWSAWEDEDWSAWEDEDWSDFEAYDDDWDYGYDPDEPLFDDVDVEEYVPLNREATLDDFQGIWVATLLTEGGATVDAAEYGMSYRLVVLGDAFGLDMGGMGDKGTAAVQDGKLMITLDGEPMAVNMHTDGTLSVADYGSILWFEFEKDAAQEDLDSIMSIDEFLASLGFDDDFMSEMFEEDVAPEAEPAGLEAFVDVDMTCLSVLMPGYDPIDMTLVPGNELRFETGGEVNFTLGGVAVEGLTWTLGMEPTTLEDAFVLDFMSTGMYLYTVAEGDGLALDYFGNVYYFEAK